MKIVESAQQRNPKQITEQLNAIVDRRRDPDHSVLEMVRSRRFGIIAGYEDQNDHDALRSDRSEVALRPRVAWSS